MERSGLGRSRWRKPADARRRGPVPQSVGCRIGGRTGVRPWPQSTAKRAQRAQEFPAGEAGRLIGARPPAPQGSCVGPDLRAPGERPGRLPAGPGRQVGLADYNRRVARRRHGPQFGSAGAPIVACRVTLERTRRARRRYRSLAAAASRLRTGRRVAGRQGRQCLERAAAPMRTGDHCPRGNRHDGSPRSSPLPHRRLQNTCRHATSAPPGSPSELYRHSTQGLPQRVKTILTADRLHDGSGRAGGADRGKQVCFHRSAENPVARLRDDPGAAAAKPSAGGAASPAGAPPCRWRRQPMLAPERPRSSPPRVPARCRTRRRTAPSRGSRRHRGCRRPRRR